MLVKRQLVRLLAAGILHLVILNLNFFLLSLKSPIRVVDFILILEGFLRRSKQAT